MAVQSSKATQKSETQAAAAAAASAVDGGVGGDNEDPAAVELTPIEVEVIDLFVNAVRLLGIPKSVGEIYGLLFISREALPLDELVARLRISKGSASQGLRFLRNLGAVKTVYVPGSRRDHYEAEAELKRLASGFMKGELQPHLETGRQRLSRLKELAAEPGVDGDAAKFYRERVQRLNNWHGKARLLLPLVQKFLG